MISILLHTALAAAPFDVGPLEPLPAIPNAIAVHDGQVVVATDEGVSVRRDGTWQKTPLPGGQALLSTPGALWVCGPAGVTRVSLGVEQVSERPCQDLASVGGRIWVLDAEGVRTLDDDAPVVLPRRPERLGGGADQAWLAGTELVSSGVGRLVFPGATDLDLLDVDGTRRWVLVHPERRLVGFLGEVGLETAWQIPFPAHHVAVGDLDGDGRRELVVAGEDTWTTLSLQAPAAPTPAPVVPRPPTPQVVLPPRPRWTPPPSKDVFGAPMPSFAGLAPDPEYDAIFVGGFGIAVGSGLGNSSVPVGFSPSAAGGLERGANRWRVFLGADSAPLFIWTNNGSNGASSGIHLAMATAGVSLGSDRFRAGPFASAGLLAGGGGLRVVFTPFESRAGKLTGFEGRLTWLAPTVAHASLYYVSAFPLGQRGRDDERAAARPSLCRRVGLGVGAAGGLSGTSAAWEFVGQDRTWQTSGSPAASLACDMGRKAVGWTLAADTAPFFFYRTPTADGGADKKLHHAGSITVNPWIGTDAIRFGPAVTGGVFVLGAGLRAVVTPFHTSQGVHHGLELRAQALFPAFPAFQGMALYHVWLDPKPGS